MNSIRAVGVGVLSLVAVIAATTAFAQSSGATPSEQLLIDRFNVELGAFVITSNVNGNLRGNVQQQTGIDFSHDFGTDADQTRWRANLLWRITSRQGLRFSYFDNDVTKTRTITRNLTWGDDTFLANAAVTAETKFRVYELGYEFSFLNAPNYKVAASAGVHVEDFTIRLAGVATVTGPNGDISTASYTSEANSFTAPLPVLGLRGDWAVADHWYVDGALQAFKFTYQGIDGNWTVFNAGATYMFSHHIGIGLSYDRFAAHVNLSKGSFNGRLNLGYQGALLYFKSGF